MNMLRKLGVRVDKLHVVLCLACFLLCLILVYDERSGKSALEFNVYENGNGHSNKDLVFYNRTVPLLWVCTFPTFLWLSMLQCGLLVNIVLNWTWFGVITMF